MVADLQLVDASRRHHAVHFYRHDDELVDRVGRYVGRAITSRSAAVVVATAGHRRALDTWLATHGTDPDDARAGALLFTVDARETLVRFLVDGNADRGRFREVVGGLVRHAGAGGRPVYIYGEMVALLWESGHVTATMAVESLWNELGGELNFSLFCGYPADSIGDDADGKRAEICALHSALISAPPRPDAGCGVLERSQTFPDRSDSPRAARHFVTEALLEWAVPGDVVDDAALVVTELTSNALLHGRAGSMVTLSRAGEAVYLAVQDDGPVLPTRRHAGGLDSSGRGLGMVAALAQRWGADLLEHGKVVWAELRR